MVEIIGRTAIIDSLYSTMSTPGVKEWKVADQPATQEAKQRKEGVESGELNLPREEIPTEQENRNKRRARSASDNSLSASG
jgi:hypothetical protein